MSIESIINILNITFRNNVTNLVNYCNSNILSIIALQFISYYLSKGRNNNIDFPRNIAKTITV